MSMRGQKTILQPIIGRVKDKDVREILQELFDNIEEINRILRADVKKTNEVLPTEEDPSFYLGEKEMDTTDPHAAPDWVDGAWRIKQVGTRLEFQKKIAGVWTRKGAITS